MFRRLAPEILSAFLAAILRGVAAALQWADNPALRIPTLDHAYYLEWARAVAAGEVLSGGPADATGPYLLNPLYVWTIAPLAAAFEPTTPAVLALQAALGAATAWLVASAARRFAVHEGLPGTPAAWMAGAAVALSSALVHLSTHVSVATLAAFLVAGALHAAAPGRAPGCGADRDPKREPDADTGRGAERRRALATGLWLGLGALARPVTLLALPFFAALAWSRAPDRRAAWRAAAGVVLVFAAFAGLSFARNVAVSGEPVVFTAANGLNLHLGQNPMARRTRAMMTEEFRFGPIEMHADAKHRVALATGHEPTRSEVSAWYRAAALDDVAENPGEALGFFVRKLAWFFSPTEPPSSADLVQDTTAVPFLRVAFVPTWLLAVLWLASLAGARRGLVLAAGGMVVAHAVSGALAFPLSHYRAPAIPAMAVAAAVGIVRISVVAGPSRMRWAGLVVAGAVVAWGVTPPAYLRSVLRVNDSVEAIQNADGPAAELAARDALSEEPGWFPALTAMSEARLLQGDRQDALAWIERAIEGQPWNVSARHLRAELLVDVGRRDDALAEVESLVVDFPWSAPARGARGELRAFTGDAAGARVDLEWAMERGFDARADALARAGLSGSD